MNINISIRHSEITQQTRDYVHDKVQKLEKFHDLRKVDVIMEADGNDLKIELVVVPERGNTIVAASSGSEWYNVLEQSLDKAERQLRKMKEKSKSHRMKKQQEEDSPQNRLGQW